MPFLRAHLFLYLEALLRREVGGKEKEIREGNCRMNLPDPCLLALLGGAYFAEMLTTCL